MTDWPTLDGPDAERAISDVFDAVGLNPEDGDIDYAIAALNDADVVLCGHTALAALRQRAIDAEAEVQRLQSGAVGPGGIVHACPGESGLMPCCDRYPFEVSAWDRLSVSGYTVTCPGRAAVADPKDGTR